MGKPRAKSQEDQNPPVESSTEAPLSYRWVKSSKGGDWHILRRIANHIGEEHIGYCGSTVPAVYAQFFDGMHSVIKCPTCRKRVLSLVINEKLIRVAEPASDPTRSMGSYPPIKKYA